MDRTGNIIVLPIRRRSSLAMIWRELVRRLPPQVLWGKKIWVTRLRLVRRFRSSGFNYDLFFFPGVYIMVLPVKGTNRVWRRNKKRRMGSKRLKSKIKNVVNSMSETKLLDVALSDTVPISGTAGMAYLTQIAQGDENYERNGDKIHIQSIQVFGTVRGDNDVSGETSVCRMILFRAKNNIRGTLPLITELLISDSVSALRHPDGFDDFKIYWDKSFVLESRIDASSKPYKLVKYYKKLGGLKCTYDGNGALIGDAETGGLFLARVVSALNTTQPTWDLNIRLRYKDL